MQVKEVKTLKKKYIVLTAVAVAGMASSVFAVSKTKDSKKAESATSAQAQLDSTAKPTLKSSITNETIEFAFPYHRPGVDKEKLEINFKINYEKSQKAMFHFTPDDCLDVFEINGKEIELTGEALAQRCNWTQGFTMDLKPYLVKGSNKVRIIVRNIGGWVGLDVAPAASVATPEKK